MQLASACATKARKRFEETRLIAFDYANWDGKQSKLCIHVCKNLQILRSSLGPLDLVGLNVWRYSGSLSVRANTGACVPPLGALFRLLSVFVAIVCVVDAL
jgi:hypothetical protein